MKKNHFLFCPGPVNVSDHVRQALRHPDMCHRSASFENIIQNVQRNLLTVYKANDDYTILLITGSGTAANETVISSYFTQEDEVLLIVNGEFGGRLEELLRIHEVKATILHYDWGASPKIADAERKLIERPEITTLMMVYHETSTSVINPVRQLGHLAHRYGKTFFVDGVSALGGEDVNVVRDNIDFCTCSSNKCLASLPGIGIICTKKSKIEATEANRTRVAYLNLHRLYKMSEAFHQTPNTPSVTMIIALDAAVERLLDEGLDEQIQRHKSCAKIIRDGVRKMGLQLLVDDSIASNTVTSVSLPSEIPLTDFIDRIEKSGYTIYPGKGPLKQFNVFQIANMGEVNTQMCHKFLKTMADILKGLSKR